MRMNVFGESGMAPTNFTVYLDKDISVEFEGIHMKVMRLSKIYEEHGWTIEAHAHSNYEFHYVYEGKGKIGLGNSEFEIAAKQFYACPPFIEHRQEADEKNPMKEFCIECQLEFDANPSGGQESSYFSQLTNKLLYCKYEDHDGCIMSSLQMIDELLDGKNSILQRGEITMVKAALMNTILSMLTFAKNKNDSAGKPAYWNDINHQRAVSIRNYMEANYKNNISISDCARIYYMSERQIDRILMQIFQETFHGYLTRIRVNVAASLISETDYPMEIIASESGFTSYRQMLRNFKKYHMENPTKIRKAKNGD